MMKYKLKQYNESIKSLEMYIYDDIQGDSYNWWDGKVTSETSSKYFKEELDKYPNVDEIHLYINSNGGDVYEAYGICSQLERHSAKIISHVDGFAASAASLLLCVSDKVIMTSQSMAMIHNMWTASCGNAKELRKNADDLDKMMEGNRTLYLKKCKNLTEEKLIEMLENEEYLTAKDCLEIGLCDEIYGETNEETMLELAQQRTNSLKMQLARQKVIHQSIQQLDQQRIKKKDEKSKESLSSFFMQSFNKEKTEDN